MDRSPLAAQLPSVRSVRNKVGPDPPGPKKSGIAVSCSGPSQDCNCGNLLTTCRTGDASSFAHGTSAWQTTIGSTDPLSNSKTRNLHTYTRSRRTQLKRRACFIDVGKPANSEQVQKRYTAWEEMLAAVSSQGWEVGHTSPYATYPEADLSSVFVDPELGRRMHFASYGSIVIPVYMARPGLDGITAQTMTQRCL